MRGIPVGICLGCVHQNLRDGSYFVEICLLIYIVF